MLTHARLLRRYQRFFADVQLADGTIVVAHVPNTGSMRTLLNPGCDAWLTPATNPQRTLRWTLTLLGTPDGGLALVDTGLPNRLVAEAVSAGAVPALSGYAACRREAPIGSRGSRCDLLLSDPARPPCYVEIKNVTMASAVANERADFPDSPTERGRKHLAELSEVVRSGARAVQFFVLGRTDRSVVGLADTIDPAYAAALANAQAAGVEVVGHGVRLDPQGVSLGPPCRLQIG
jgi:sugar fermentation stimulation protein A